MTALPDYPQALALALQTAKALNRTEIVRLEAALGRVLAAPISADRDLPPFHRAQMDGYALRSSEYAKAKPFLVTGSVPAGSSGNVRIQPGECVAIATGAPLPANVDAVVPHEACDSGRVHDGQVRFSLESISPGHAVHARGSDAKAGQILIQAPTKLGAHHLGIAAAVGVAQVQTHVKPRVIVLTSGDEIVPANAPASSLLTHQVRNSNGPMVCALLSRFGAEPIESLHLQDERDVTMSAVNDALGRGDALVTIGGVSAGERDHFPDAFAAANVQASLQGASIQPGRPIFVGRAPSGCVVIGLPGNPVSVLACACLFLWPLLRTMLGLNPSLNWREVELAVSVKPNAMRRAFRPAAVQDDGRVIVPSWAGSGDLAHTAATDGLLELPVQAEPVKAGARLRFLPWP